MAGENEIPKLDPKLLKAATIDASDPLGPCNFLLEDATTHVAHWQGFYGKACANLPIPKGFNASFQIEEGGKPIWLFTKDQ